MTFQEAWDWFEDEMIYVIGTMEEGMDAEEDGRLFPKDLVPLLKDMKEVVRKHVPKK